jgi:dienelactone hydrolase
LDALAARALHADAELRLRLVAAARNILMGPTMHLSLKSAAVLFLFIQSAPLSAAEDFKIYAGPLIGEDLTFPAAPEPLGYAKASKMFKPAGTGPFPAVVILPTCGGHDVRHAFDVWAKAALQRGYAVLVVDPLTPRGVVVPGENCRPGNKVREVRLRKDAFDAAEHLRKQPFVDPERIGLLGMSQGAMAALGASAPPYDTPQGRRAFRAIVSIYPACFFANVPIPGRPFPMNLDYLPPGIVVPLLVQMGDLDTETPPKDCISRLQEQKDKGAPVEFVVHKNATHAWDQGRNFAKKGLNGQDVAYRYNPKVTAESVRLAFDFLDSHVRGSDREK